MLEIRSFRCSHIDVDTGLPHFEQHGVTEAEVLRVLDRPIENRSGSGDSRILIGWASGGRFIRVVASFDDDGEGVFVITALKSSASRCGHCAGA